MIRRVLLAACAAVALVSPAQAQDQFVVTPDQLRAAALTAFEQGSFEQARQFAEALAQRDAADPVARGILAQLALSAGDAETARAEAATLWRTSTDPEDRYQAARLAAYAAAQGGNLTFAQFWLRRALTVAPDEAARRQTIADFQAIRARNPLSVDLSFSLSPSDNVNGGAESAYNVIDGFPLVGVLSPDAQALSGWVGSFDLSGRYRLSETQTSRTEATLRFWTRQVWLSREARDFIDDRQDDGDPEIRNQDFASSIAEVGLSHEMLFLGGISGANLTFGRAWASGERNYDYLRVSFNHLAPLGEQTQLRSQAYAEQRWTPEGKDWDERVGVQADWVRRLQSGASVSAQLAWGETLSDSVNRASESWTVAVGYTPARPVGPVYLSLSLGAQVTDYPGYMVAIFPVPGGRQDDRVFADVTLRLPSMSYAGFSPQITVGYDQVDSNVSRFTRDGFSVDFGIRSDF